MGIQVRPPQAPEPETIGQEGGPISPGDRLSIRRVRIRGRRSKAWSCSIPKAPA